MNGLYVRAAICMIAAPRINISDAVAAVSKPIARHRVRWLSRQDPSIGMIGADPMIPRMSASTTSGVKYQATLNGVGAVAACAPNMVARNESALGSESARKNTQPIITTSNKYVWRTGSHNRL